jgi:methionyl aminopeptidase
MIELKSAWERERMRRAGRVAAEVLRVLARAVQPGMRTAELDALAEREVRKRGGIPVFKGYHGYPKSVCVSVNDEVVHGIPGSRRLKEGDLVGLDFGALVDGFVGDTAVSVFVGDPPSERAYELWVVTREALYNGIAAAVAGARLGDVSHAVQRTVEAHGFNVVREFVGHGIGRQMHEDPQVPNYGEPGRGVLLRPGMALAIEPMVNLGGWEVDVREDGWTVVTRDGSLSCHFEHTIFIGEDGTEILTLLEDDIV